jgi:hypothetical protein
MTSISAHQKQLIGLSLLVLLGFILRTWGIAFGLPNTNCRPDESTLVHRALSIGGGELNPHFFNYPSFHFYLLTALYGAYYLAGSAVGLFAGKADFLRTFLGDPSAWYLLGRYFTASLGAVSLVPAFLIGRQLGGPRTGFVGAFFLCLAFLHTRDSHFLTVDIPATTHLLFGALFAVRYAKSESIRDLVTAALFMGLSASTKYNAIVLGGPILLISVLSRRPVYCQWRRAGWVATILVVAFLSTSPYVVLDYQRFLQDIAFERNHFSAGHHGGLDLGVGWAYHLTSTLPVGLGWPLFAAAAVGLGWQLLCGRVEDRALACGVLTYFAVAGSGRSVFMRYALPLVPFLCVAGARVLAVATERIRWPWLCLVAGVLAAPTALSTLSHNLIIERQDTRLEAAAWIETNIPGKSKIALVGSDYGYPKLRRSQRWMRERLADLRLAGLPAKRLQLSLETAPDGIQPSYDIVQIESGQSATLRSVWAAFDLDRLRSEGIDWVVLQDHPLAYSRTDSSITKALKLAASRVALFDPFVDGGASPRFDPLDAYYVPIDGFSAARQPGPRLEIWRIDP